MKYREGCLIVPVRDRCGNPTEKFRAELVSDIVKAFGGITITDGDGYWRNGDGMLLREPVKILTVAMPAWIKSVDALGHEQSELGNVRLQGFAARIGKALDQDAVYIRYSDGEVCFLTHEQWTALTT